MTSRQQGPEHNPAAQALAELGRLVLSEQSTESVLQRIAELAKQLVPGTSEASLTLVRGGVPSTAVFTGALAKDLDESQYRRGYGPCLSAAESGVVVSIEDTRTESRWRDYNAAADSRGARSSLSVPLPLQLADTAALNLYSAEPESFSGESVTLAALFASYAAVALTNMSEYDDTRQRAAQMQAAMESRAVIEQAKGLIMGQRGCTADEAFQLLVQTSQRANRKLRDVAQTLVDGATRASAPRRGGPPG